MSPSIKVKSWGPLLGLLVITCSATAQTYRVIELGSLAQGNPAVVHGPNIAGTGVGGGRLMGAAGADGQRRGVLFDRGTALHVTGLPASDDVVIFGLNDSGRMVGTFNAATAVRGFVASRAGAPAELPPLAGDSASAAFAVNNIGQSVGFSSGSTGQRAVMWDSNRAPRALPTLAGTTGARATGVNEQGDVAGVANSSRGQQPVVWRAGGAPSQLPLLAGHSSGEASAINARGDVAGFSTTTSAARRATFWPSGGPAVDLGILSGGDFSQAFGVNDSGDIVGASNSKLGNRAVLWTRSGGIQDLNTLIGTATFVLTKAVGINNAGVILVTGRDAVPGHDVAGGQGGDGAHAHQDEHDLPVRVFVLTRAGGGS